jgi:hypothetical protein
MLLLIFPQDQLSTIRRFGDEVLDCLDDVLRTYDGLEEIESLHPRAMPGGREG